MKKTKLNTHFLKGGNFIAYFIAVLLAIVYITSCSSSTEENMTQYFNPELITRTDEGCGPDTIGCIDTIMTQRTDVQIVIGSCTLKVDYLLTLCVGSGNYTTRLSFSNLNIVSYDSGCDSMRQSWSDLYAMGQYSQLNNDMNEFHNLLNTKIEDYEILVLNQFPCGEGGDPCDENNPYSLEFFVAECYKRCAYYDEGEEMYNITEVNCGTACCRRITAFCVSNGIVQRCTPRLVSNGGEFACSGQVEPGACQGVLFGSCMNPCEKLDN